MINFNYSLEPGKNRELLREYTNYKKVISIITPAWNPTEYLLQTANCILNQTYPYFEWLIIDDGSTNKESLELLKKVEEMDSRIKVLHKKNEGLSKTRDYGVKHSSKETDIVVFIDDDDLLDKWNGPYLYKAIPNDPWGNMYEYMIPGNYGQQYGIRSFGADGYEGGEGNNADITSWE